MKKKLLAAVLTTALSVSAVLAGCGGSSSTSYAGKTVTGEVTATGDASVTIEVSSVADASGNAESADAGTTLTVAITDDTTITSSQGGMSGGMGGGMSGAPGGDSSSGDMGGAPSGDQGSTDGAPSGEAPSGEAPSDQGGSDSSESDSEVTTLAAESDSSSAEGEAPSGEAPSGEAPSGEAPSGEAPSGDQGSSDGAPSGEAPSGDMGGSASGDMGGNMGGGDTSLTVADITVGDTVSVTFDEDGNATSITIGGSGSSSSNGDITYTANTEYTEDEEVYGITINSTGTDENGILLQTEGVSVVLSEMYISRESDDSTGGDNSSFYGVGASVLATAGTLNITGAEIVSDAAGGAGVFAYGDGVVYISDSDITTQQDTSGGIHVAGGGTLYAWDLTVETNGGSSAAIRSDRGAGTMVVDGGEYTSNGTGSPAIYSTADITVNEAELTATGSEAICIEGLNTIRLYDCDLTGNMSDDDQNDITWNVILYQSMSGDSEEGNSTFEMSGGTLTAENGGMFYTTNTESTFILNDVDITYAEDSEFFLQCTGNTNERGWGTEGENGADCLFTAISQEMEGDVIYDSVSTLDFYMTDGSTLTGAFVDDETWAGDGGDGECNVYISDDSKWVVTGDSTVTNLYSEGTIVDEDGNTVTIEGTDGTVYVEGTSSYTITVTSYSDSVDLSGASSVGTFSDYEVEEPDSIV
ncbi:MAG: hypothetical protein K5840_01990 [Eubacterium sp.]|nr:hypothetical protein [Eubacterium sp.]